MMNERRLSTRSPVRLPVRLKAKGMVRWAETTTKDLSVQGFRCAMYGTFWPVGALVSFEIPLFLAETPLAGMASIVRMAQIRYSDQYHVGLKFSHLSTGARRQLQRYLKKSHA